MATSYTPLEPTTYSALGAPAPTFNSGVAPSLITSTTFLYTLFFSAIVVGAFYRYGIAGLEMMRASEEGLRKSKEIMRKTTFGLLGVFSLFLILLTVNKDMLLGDIGLGALALKGGEYGGAGASGVVPGASTQTVSHAYTDRVASHNAVVARLSPSGIHTNHGDAPCTEAQFSETTPSCTSLTYLPEETIQKLLSLHSACNCGDITISGGTEPGHATHGENKSPVDLRISQTKDDALYMYIKKNATSVTADTSSCYYKYIWSGVSFCDEKPRGNSTWAPHFHLY